jgi:uncharacterized membrane protein YdfJ with MMPL/SSD domain
MATAGRAVLFSAATVAGACAALALFPQQFIRSMGIAGVLTAGFAATAALAVVPALLPRVGAGDSAHGRTPPAATGGWYRFSRWVMRHPVPVALAAALAMLALAAPVLGVRWTFLDAKALPAHLESREVANTIAEEFVPNLEFPITVAIPAAAHVGDEVALARRIGGLPGAGLVSEVQRAPDGTRTLHVLSRAPPLTDTSQRLVRYIRALPGATLVGGHTADFLDMKASIRAHAGPALAVVTGATLLFVFLLTGSFVLPVKTLLMNGLTIFAVLGLMVTIFQHGALGIPDLLTYDGYAAIETTISVVVVAVTLGLATDYSVLLISRIKEEHEAGRPNEEAVAIGLERSGRVITNAAMLLVVAMLAAAWGRIFAMQQLVVGVALGVAIDATLVRACLVPALMRLLGDLNWWAPAGLRRGLSGRALAALRAEPSTPPPEGRPSSP